MLKDRIAVIIQARMGSTRLPGKTLAIIKEKPMLSYQIERLKHCKLPQVIVIATTVDSRDDPIAALALQENIPVFRGSEEDVLKRYRDAADHFEADIIVRVTGDCPLADPQIIDEAIKRFQEGSYDYLSNTLARTFPRGLDVEVFSKAALMQADAEARTPSEREHVTLFMYRHPELFKLGHFQADVNNSHYRLTVDLPEDFLLISKIFEALYVSNPAFGLKDILKVLKKNPKWIEINSNVEQKVVP